MEKWNFIIGVVSFAAIAFEAVLLAMVVRRR
jgi:hypothetical protein